MILDTSFLIDLLRGNDAVDSVVAELDDQRAGTVTAISIMELWEGIHLADATEDELDRVRRLLSGLSQADFDTESAMLAGEASAGLSLRGSQIDVEDVMIWAIAKSRNERIVTGNPTHFDRLDGVEIIGY